jgi:hypothetical protein
MKVRGPGTPEAAETIAIQALSFIAGDGERLGRFLAITGIGPSDIRTAATEPSFLAGVLDYLAADERLLKEFTGNAGLAPDDVARAHVALGGIPWERHIP